MYRGCAQRSVMSLALRCISTFMIAKAGFNINQVNSTGSSMPRAPMGREEPLEEVLDLCEHT